MQAMRATELLRTRRRGGGRFDRRTRYVICADRRRRLGRRVSKRTISYREHIAAKANESRLK